MGFCAVLTAEKGPKIREIVGLLVMYPTKAQICVGSYLVVKCPRNVEFFELLLLESPD